MSPNQALLTLHANYRKWYSAAQPDLDDAVGHTQTQVLLRATQIRFMPECLYFVFKYADDYCRSPDCQNPIDPVPKDSTFARLSSQSIASFIIRAMSLLIRDHDRSHCTYR